MESFGVKSRRVEYPRRREDSENAEYHNDHDQFDKGKAARTSSVTLRRLQSATIKMPAVHFGQLVMLLFS